MDPDANWEEQLRLAADILNEEDGGPGNHVLAAGRLAELVLSLNDWLSKGGFPPKAWQKGTSTG